MKSSELIREKRFIVILLLGLLLGFAYMIRPFLMSMLVAGIMAVVFYPLFNKLSVFLGNRRRMSALTMTIFILFMIIIPAGYVITVLIDQIYQYVGTLNLNELFSQLFTTNIYAEKIAPFLTDLEMRYQIKIDLFGMLTNLGKQVAGFIGSYSPSVLMGTAGFLFSFLITLVGIYFLFVDGPALVRLIFDLSPLQTRYQTRLARRLRDTLDACVYGYLVSGILLAFISSFMYGIVGIQAYVILGALTFFMSMVPIVGTLGVWVPVCVWLFSNGQVWEGVVVIVGGCVVAFIDYFAKPLIIKGKTQIHPLLIFFSLLGGIGMFGLLGVVFGPVITALMIAMIKIYQEEFAHS
ncbi:MAG: hypothetical protein ACD_62C00037G0001 [uncultured bacterium]|nr:MAG: hypothetical protein ACD_62C00037G0001 [uncultured bacterium]HLD43936.1 AI-2E family transporter [bacterium]